MDGATPVGAAGLSCFTKSGEKIWDHEAPAGFDQIGDCYVLNAAEMGCGVTTTRISRIANIDSDFRVRCWNTKVSGATTLAVAAKRVLLFGGYGDRRIECHLITLDDGDARLDAEASLVLPREIRCSQKLGYWARQTTSRLPR